MTWKKQDKKDVLLFEGIKDHMGVEIQSNTGENIEIYTIFGRTIPKFTSKILKRIVGNWKIKT